MWTSSALICSFLNWHKYYVMRAFEFFTKVTESKKETPKADAMAAALGPAIKDVLAKAKEAKQDALKTAKPKSQVQKTPIPLPSEKPVESLDEAAQDTASAIKVMEAELETLKKEIPTLPAEMQNKFAGTAKIMQD